MRLASEVGGLDAELLLETFREVGRAVETDHIADFADAILTLFEQTCSVLQANHLYHLVGRCVGQSLYFGKESRATDSKLLRQEIYAEFAV